MSIATNEDGTVAVPMKLVELVSPVLDCRAFRGPNGLNVLIGREGGDWHISLSTETRYPTWDELRDVCWALGPGVRFKLVIPTADDAYTNLHNYCLHVWQDREATP